MKHSKVNWLRMKLLTSNTKKTQIHQKHQSRCALKFAQRRERSKRNKLHMYKEIVFELMIFACESLSFSDCICMHVDNIYICIYVCTMYISMFELSLYAHAIFLFMVLSSSLFCSFFFLFCTRSPYEKKTFHCLAWLCVWEIHRENKTSFHVNACTCWTIMLITIIIWNEIPENVAQSNSNNNNTFGHTRMNYFYIRAANVCILFHALDAYTHWNNNSPR